ncbi:MAG: sulfatase [Verrucomicrobiae bacterium]|nr:sulfatase [Verrucomicrobiae bacterium]MCP5539247.1 sulfatase [Akkermansiaceae bacterium]
MAAILVLFGLFAHLGPTNGAEKYSAIPSPPNILFILTDDQGWPTLGSYGNERVPTPHLDRLAAEGMRFTDAYVMPQCTPTRAALLTGRHSARSGMWHVIPWYGYPWAPVSEPAFTESLSRESFTVAKGLKTAGYTTACIGKWHLTEARDGNYVALKPESAPFFGFDEAPVPPDWSYHKQGDKGVAWLTDRALDFIGRHRDRPWFVYLAHHTIHGPVVAPEEIVAKYRALGAPEAGPHNATYLAAIEILDTGSGRLLEGLERLGEASETLVVFLSDNGGVDTLYDATPFTTGSGKLDRLQIGERQFSNSPLRAGKGSPYEGGIRVPCLVRWPGVVPEGAVNSTPIHVVDWLPTLLEAAGAEIPPSAVVDGQSLVPLLRRSGSLPPRPLFWHLPLYDLRWGATPCAVVREGDWKLIEYFGDRFDRRGNYVPGAALELFNLKSDLGESLNLADTESARAASLRKTLRAWLDSIPAEIPGPNPHRDSDRPFAETKEKQPWNR